LLLFITMLSGISPLHSRTGAMPEVALPLMLMVSHQVVFCSMMHLGSFLVVRQAAPVVWFVFCKPFALAAPSRETTFQQVTNYLVAGARLRQHHYGGPSADRDPPEFRWPWTEHHLSRSQSSTSGWHSNTTRQSQMLLHLVTMQMVV